MAFAHRTAAPETGSRYLVTSLSPRSPVGESYRIFRTNLQFLSLDQPLRHLVVTSAVAGEGKTLTVANLGVVQAQAGKKVIMVDADLRRPALNLRFELPGHAGLTTWLAGDGNLEEVLQPTHVPGLSLLASGPIPPNPAELLGSSRLTQLMVELAGLADLVIWDTPPAVTVSDASVLAARADGTILVVRAGREPFQSAQKAKEQLQQVGARVLGVVLDAVPIAQDPGYYNYYYGAPRHERG
ncbi:MAG: CpsD/CapB family tyrosine-protein kinase [Symbiobacteriia bacterium]